MRLADLTPPDYQPELEFLFAAHGVNTRALDDAVTHGVLPGGKTFPPSGDPRERHAERVYRSGFQFRDATTFWTINPTTWEKITGLTG